MNCRCGMEIEKAVITINGEEFCSFECAGQLAPYTSKAEIERLDAEISKLSEAYDNLQAALVLPKRVITEPKAIGGMCEICGKETAVGVATSTLGPVIYKYGMNCLETGSEPYQALVLFLRKKGGRKNAMGSPAVYSVIDATLLTAGKTVTELDDDIERR